MKPRKPIPRSTKPIQRSPLKRSTTPIARTPVKKVRAKPRPGRVKGADLTARRAERWVIDKGICQGCFRPCDPKNWHLAHFRNKRMWGDGIENMRVKHPDCHLVIEHSYGPSGQKPCPPKP